MGEKESGSEVDDEFAAQAMSAWSQSSSHTRSLSAIVEGKFGPEWGRAVSDLVLDLTSAFVRNEGVRGERAGGQSCHYMVSETVEGDIARMAREGPVRGNVEVLELCLTVLSDAIEVLEFSVSSGVSGGRRWSCFPVSFGPIGSTARVRVRKSELMRNFQFSRERGWW